MYCTIINNEIAVKYDDVPISFRIDENTDIDGFNNLSDAEREEYNFYQIVITELENWDAYHTYELVLNVVEGKPVGEYIIIPVSNDDWKRLLTQAVQRRLDRSAIAKGYDSILAACSYATSTNPIYAAEGAACVAWRDAVWTKCYEMLVTPYPAEAELVSALPRMVWPS